MKLRLSVRACATSRNRYGHPTTNQKRIMSKSTRARKGKAPQVSSPIATTSGQPSSSIPQTDDSRRALWCLVEGKTTAFKVNIPANNDISDLKEAIKLKNNNDLGPYDAHTLVLLQVRNPRHRHRLKLTLLKAQQI